jgi:hypothetical protein
MVTSYRQEMAPLASVSFSFSFSFPFFNGHELSTRNGPFGIGVFFLVFFFVPFFLFLMVTCYRQEIAPDHRRYRHLPKCHTHTNTNKHSHASSLSFSLLRVHSLPLSRARFLPPSLLSLSSLSSPSYPPPFPLPLTPPPSGPHTKALRNKSF